MTTVALVGSEVPRLMTPPARELTPQTSRGFEAAAFAEDVLGVTLMPWQRRFLVHGLELTEAGAYRFRTLLCLTARQSGKSTLLQVLALWRVYVDRAPLVLGTAQNLGLAEETWQGALQLAEGVPELAREIGHVSRTNGDKYLRLTSGERYKVAAATRGGGRGLSSDLVLLDELREHRDWEAWSAVTKTTLARPAPMVVGCSNAGDGQSVVLASLRDKALASAADRSSSLGIFEWSAPDGCELTDRAAWAQASPALGHRISEQAILSALETDPEGVFRTEVLCQWVDSVVVPAVDPDVWASLADPGAKRGTAPAFAVATAPDRSWSAIGVAWRRADGRVQVMVTDYRPGAAWVPARAAELRSTWGGPVACDTAARGLVDGAVELSIPQQAQAHNALADAVDAGTVRHGNEPELLTSVRSSQWRPQGDTRVLDRKGSVDISPLIAVALALAGLSIRAVQAPAPRMLRDTSRSTTEYDPSTAGF